MWLMLFQRRHRLKNPSLAFVNTELSFGGTDCFLLERGISSAINILLASTWQWMSLQSAYKSIIYISAKIKDLSLFLVQQLWGYQELSIIKWSGKSEWDKQLLRAAWKPAWTSQSECDMNRWDIWLYARDSHMESGHRQNARLTSLGDN